MQKDKQPVNQTTANPAIKTCTETRQINRQAKQNLVAKLYTVHSLLSDAHTVDTFHAITQP